MLTSKQLKALRQTSVEATGNRVAAAMKMLALTQEQLAAGTGFRQTYISVVCRGVNGTITVDNARPFAKFFGCSIEDLFPEKEAVAS